MNCMIQNTDDQVIQILRNINKFIDDRNKRECFDGKVVTLTDIEKSPGTWSLVDCSNSVFNKSSRWVTRDDKYVLEFAHRKTTGTIKAQYYPGMSVGYFKIGESPYWTFIGQSDTTQLYVNRDKDMVVLFGEHQNSSVIEKLNEFLVE